jgi:hypothetical protein
MQKTFSYVKECLKYTTILLAVLLFIGQIYLGFIKENQEINIKEKHLLSPIQNEVNDECQNSLLKNLGNLVFKCSLAFLAGGLISEMKFIKIGIL